MSSLLGIALAVAWLSPAAARRCAYCGSKEQCRAWLASGREGGNPTFCPNAGLFNQGSGR